MVKFLSTTIFLSFLVFVFQFPNDDRRRDEVEKLKPSDYQNIDNYRKAKIVNQELINGMMNVTNIPGLSVAVHVEDKIVWNESFGFEDLENRTKVSKHSKFRIASISKLFTGSLLGKLWEQKLIDLEAPIGNLLDSIPSELSEITLQQLGEHSSGIPHYLDVEDALDIKEYDDPFQAVKKFINRPLEHAPGKGKTYSSYAYTVIAVALEKAIGDPFTRIIEDQLFIPLCMKETCPDYQRKIISNRTGFYQFDEEGKVENAPFINLSGRWAGSGFLSTSGDLATFGAAHYHDSKFFSQETITRITSIRDLEEVELNEGLGWGPRKGYENREMFFGDGSTPGATGGLLVFPRNKVTVSLLSNVRKAPINRGELQSIAQPFVLSSEGKNIDFLSSDLVGKYKIFLDINGQEIDGELIIEQVNPTIGYLDFPGLQKFSLSGGFICEEATWLFGISHGRDPISLGILPMKLEISGETITGEVFRIGAKISGTKM